MFYEITQEDCVNTLPTIISATLLSAEEVEQLLTIDDCRYDDWWWILTPGHGWRNSISNTIMSVYWGLDRDSDSNVDDDIPYLQQEPIFYEGCSTAFYKDYVRPALNITNVKHHGLKIGDIFMFGGKFFKIISYNLAFCLEDIGKCYFREDQDASDANIYYVSDIKKFVDTWFEEARKNPLAERKESPKIMPEIKAATLWSSGEAKCLTYKERSYQNWWWVQSPGTNQDRADYVDKTGSFSHYGRNVNNSYGSVRPTLIIDLSSSNYKREDTFLFGDKTFKIITRSAAFCLEDIGQCCFREDYEANDANDYEVSDVKKFIDAWFKKAKKNQKED